MGRFVFCLFIIGVIVSAGGAAVAAPDPATAVLQLPYKSLTAQTDTSLEHIVLGLMNRERRTSGVSPLVSSIPLQVVARDHGRDLFARGVLSHLAPDGRNPRDRFLHAGIPFRVAGENVAYAPDVHTAHSRLMASPGHRRNILSSSYRRVGIGVLNAGRAGLVIVQDFSD